MLQDLLGNFDAVPEKTDSLVAGIIGYRGRRPVGKHLLYRGVVDPLGGVKKPVAAVRYL